MDKYNKRKNVAQKKLKKDKSIIKSCFLLFAILAILIIGVGLYLSNWYKNNIYSLNSSSLETVNFEVKDGDTLTNIASTLQNKGLIKSELALRIYLRLNQINAEIKTAKYLIPKNLNIPDLITVLETGVTQKTINITFIDGENYEKSADRIALLFNTLGSENKFDKTTFLNICDNPDNFTFTDTVQSFLNKFKPKRKSLRGFIFPDTYNVDSTFTSQQVIETAITNLQTRLIEKGIDINNIRITQNELKNFYDALTLASIIQKESGRISDNGNISSVFHNRLADNYPLESDVTINFALHNNDPNISIQDTKIESPYNTYIHSGLPPTPIDDPGIDAIVAAIKPNNTNYYFFLYDKSGKVFFSSNYYQHQKNINNHL